MLRHDLYTNRHTQWFYFRVSNTRRGVPYRFTITNMLKARRIVLCCDVVSHARQSGSLYNAGMRPLMYSQRSAETLRHGFGLLCSLRGQLSSCRWRRCGSSIQYVKTDQVHASSTRGRVRYVHRFSWTHVFDHDHDTVYFAQCYPYTYSGADVTGTACHRSARRPAGAPH